MGSPGAAPNPYTTRKVSTRFLRVPLIDWPSVKIGRKTEFRKFPHRSSTIFPYTPTPVVGYAARGATYDHGMLVLEAMRTENLWDIKDNEESLRREGFDTYEEFRDYWKHRHNSRYRPLDPIVVYTVRPLNGITDQMILGELLYLHLYQDFV